MRNASAPAKRSLLSTLLGILALTAGAARADGPAMGIAPLSFYGNVYYHSESRLDALDITRVTYSNMEFSIGVDFLLNPESLVFAGSRAGIYQEQVLTKVPVGPKNSRPFIGGQAYKLFPFQNYFGVKLGGAADLMIPPSGSDSPVWLYVGALGGLRVDLAQELYLEVPLEVGLTPFFSGTPLFLKAGFQVGVRI